MCVSVCLRLRALITSGMIWCDIGCVSLVKSVLKLQDIAINILERRGLSNTAHWAPSKDVEVDAILAIN